MRIIVGVDDSPFSAAAVNFVRGMVWPTGTHVDVICAVPLVMVAIPESYMVMSDQLETLHREQRAASGSYVKTVERDLAASGLKAEGRVADGDPRDLLLEAAREGHADLIVVGSHGRTGMAKLFMGSVASHVVTHAPCSVLVVRGPAKP
jgi:nucleotide-binding universal stress UspA family protein